MTRGLTLPGERTRQWLSWPAALLDGCAVAPEPVSLAARHARLRSSAFPPEGWLALQRGLHTVGDAQTWASFAMRGATVLAVGGVHGADREAAFTRFRDETRALGVRRQAVYPVREPDLSAAAAAGFSTIPVGVESWVPLREFTLRGKRYADLRQMRNRARRHGVVVREVEPKGLSQELQETWHASTAARGVPWRIRWLSGEPDFDALWGRRTFVALHEAEVQAFCTLLPGSRGQVSLDVLCRSPAARPGSVELLLVETLTRLQQEGLQHVSLGPCPLAGPAQALGGGWGSAFRWAWGSRFGDKWFGFRRLMSFKEKFRPSHEPVHLALAPQLTAFSLYLVARIWAFSD